MADFTHFSNMIPRALRKYKMTRQARAALICERFRGLAPDVIGDTALEHIRPKFFKKHTLYISVPNSAWAQRVYVHRHDLIMKLNLNMDKEWVQEIRTFVEGEWVDLDESIDREINA